MDNLGYVPEENGRVFAISRYPPSNQNEYLVEVNSRSKFLRKPAFYKRISILLLILAVIFLIALIILIVLYLKRRPHICTSDECLRAATNFKYSMDLSVDPCDDFYKFTCGNWKQEHPNHGWYPSFSTFATIDEKLLITMNNFFQSTPADDEPKAVEKARNMYESCMDVDSLDTLGMSVVYKYLKKMGLPVVPSLFTMTAAEQKSFKFDWMKVEANLKKDFSMDVYFGCLVSANLYNISENVLFIGTPGQKCPLPSPFKKMKNIKGSKSDHSRKLQNIDNESDDNDSNDASEEDDFDEMVRSIRAKMVKYIIRGTIKNNSMADPKEETLDEAANMINNMTEFVQELSKNYTAGQNDYNIISKSIFTLQNETDGILMNNINKNYPDFYQKYINYIFEGTNVKFEPKTDMLYIYELEEKYLAKILAYLLNMSEIYIELYMWWVTVYAMVMSTSSNIVEYIARQTAPYYGDNSVIRSRSIECTSLVGQYMGMAVSYILADKAFKNNTKPKVEKMINEIKSAFVEGVNSLKWMDAATKKATLDKCHETLSFVGYPDWLFKDGSIDHFYEKIEMKPDTFLENMIFIIEDDFINKVNLLREHNSRNWSTEPNTVNAYNSFFDNAINVPMAILNFPMYHLGLEVLNYGSIGAILGHELTHGFDNSGRKHDKFGNYIQWWSNNTIETFEKMTECFIDQYNNYTLEGIDHAVDGEKTLGENLADNGGLNQAFKAYLKHVKKYGEENILPGFENYSNYQLFFIAYGSIWCETSTKQELESQLEYDEHCPNEVRVRGTIQNSEDFARVFKCPKGSKMNPKKPKCRIW